VFDLNDTTLACTQKGCPGILDWLPTGGCYVCPVCGWEVFGRPSRKVTTKDAQIVYRLTLMSVDLLRKHGGGSRMAGRKRKNKQTYKVEGVQPWVRDYGC
jgi:hypothetical protein